MKSVLSVFAISFSITLSAALWSAQAASATSQPGQVAMVAVSGLPIEVSASCDKGTAVFKVMNPGETLPSAIIFNILEVKTNTVVSKRRMSLAAGQSATFKLKSADKVSGDIGLFMDAKWLPRDRRVDASVRCSG